MRRIVGVLATLAAAAGFSLALAPSAAAAPDSGYDCGFDRDWTFSAYWNNCVDHGQLLAVTYGDTLTNNSYNQYVCVEAQQVEMLMPTYYVFDATVAGDC